MHDIKTLIITSFWSIRLHTRINIQRFPFLLFAIVTSLIQISFVTEGLKEVICGRFLSVNLFAKLIYSSFISSAVIILNLFVILVQRYKFSIGIPIYPLEISNRTNIFIGIYMIYTIERAK